MLGFENAKKQKSEKLVKKLWIKIVNSQKSQKLVQSISK